jgi:hypothetical protein
MIKKIIVALILLLFVSCIGEKNGETFHNQYETLNYKFISFFNIQQMMNYMERHINESNNIVAIDIYREQIIYKK